MTMPMTMTEGLLLIAVALLLATVAALVRLVTSARRLITVAETIHYDLTAFNTMADLTRAIDASLGEIRILMGRQTGGLQQVLASAVRTSEYLNRLQKTVGALQEDGVRNRANSERVAAEMGLLRAQMAELDAQIAAAAEAAAAAADSSRVARPPGRRTIAVRLTPPAGADAAAGPSAGPPPGTPPGPPPGESRVQPP